MNEKANITLTFYVTDSVRRELDRQKNLFTDGVLSYHARACLEHGLKHYAELEQAKTQKLFETVCDANET